MLLDYQMISNDVDRNKHWDNLVEIVEIVSTMRFSQFLVTPTSMLTLHRDKENISPKHWKTWLKHDTPATMRQGRILV